MKQHHVLPLLCALAAAMSVSAPISAQGGIASSENFVTLAPIQPGGVGLATSTNYAARMTLGLVPSAVTASSAQHVAHVGFVAFEPQLAPGAPLVFATQPGVGSKTGGEAITIRGFNLDDGSGAALATLVGVPATGVTATSNTVLTTKSAKGVNSLGNPLGAGDVTVTTAAGTSTLSSGFVYAPAIASDTAPRVGQLYPLDVHLPAGSFYQVVVGKSVAGVSAPVPPLAGAAELVLGIVPITPLQYARAELETLLFPIPDNAALVGASVELQAVVLTGLAPLAGSFTNRLATAVAP